MEHHGGRTIGHLGGDGGRRRAHRPRRRALTAAAAAILLAATLVLLPTSPAAAYDPLTVTPSTGLTDGTSVQVTGTITAPFDVGILALCNVGVVSNIASYGPYGCGNLRFFPASPGNFSLDATMTLSQRLSPIYPMYEQICNMGVDCAVLFFSQRNGAMTVNASHAVTFLPAALPGAPTIDSVSSSYDTAELAWSPPADDGGAPVNGYLITTYLDGVRQGARRYSSTTTATIPSLREGGTYTFAVSARNFLGEGPESAPSAPVVGSLPSPGTVLVSLGEPGSFTTVFCRAPGSPYTGSTECNDDRSGYVTTLAGSETASLALPAGTYNAAILPGPDAWPVSGPVEVTVGGTTACTVTVALAPDCSAVTGTTTVSSNLNPSVTGQAVTFSATTTVAATGSMAFYDGTTLLGTKAVSAGSASLKTVLKTGGSHAITARFQETPSSATVGSATLDQQVDPAATTTVLTSTANPAVIGQTITVRATVKPVAPGTGAPAGTVDLYDGGTLVASKAQTSGSAAFALKPSVGTHTYTATYRGSTSYAASSTTANLDQTVVGADGTTTVLTSTANPSSFGQTISLKATVASTTAGTGIPAGTVDLYDDGVLIATKAQTNGTATFALKPTAGTHTYTATYQGAPGYPGSTTASALEQTVDPAATTTVLTSSVNPSVTGQTTTVRAAVKAVAPGTGTPAGVVDLYDNGVLIASKAQTSGSANFSLKPSVGTHTYTAVYQGSTSFQTSTTAAGLDQTVAPAATTITLTSSYPTTTLGHSGVITARVVAASPGYGTPTGMVEFFDDGVPLAVVPLTAGRATVPLATLGRGSHAITATYTGSPSFLSASSTPLLQAIT